MILNGENAIKHFKKLLKKNNLACAGIKTRQSK